MPARSVRVLLKHYTDRNMLHAVVASSSCLISKVRVSLSLRDRVSSGSFGFALVLAQD